ncbi:MAG TPA: S8 family serine peptidase, partial [Ktedonobacteraceae bacterium]|nr:S8 family serine peptidase [Ktedonobacteraceae bacterium]
DCSCQPEEHVRTLEDLDLLQLGLHLVIQRLTELGAVVVAAAGNDSNIPLWIPWTQDLAPRNGPRYPAAYPEVISVGAVDKYGRAAQYSNYPQLPPYHNGIATYGGSIPTPIPRIKPGGHVPPDDRGPDPYTLTSAIDVDGVIGVYTAPRYPALSRDDPSDSYDTPEKSYDWAYWSGTSFAAPIISAVAARLLQLKSSTWLPDQRAAEVQKAITTPAGESALLTGGSPLPLQTDFGFGVRVLKAYQSVDDQQASNTSKKVASEAM